MFNPGDKVVVVDDRDSDGLIKIGEVYTVCNCGGRYITLFETGIDWYAYRFQLTHENVEKLLTEYYEGQG